MESLRFTPEFKEEAVKQVVERGYSVAEMSARLGVSAHRLYKWAKSVTPDKTGQQSKELLEAKHEILRLRAQMRRVEEERDLLKKGHAVLCQGGRVKYRFMIQLRQDYSATLMCRVLKIARAGFDQWLHTPESNCAVEDRRLLRLIRQSYEASHGVNGARRVFGDLREIGETCGKHRIERIMESNKIKAVRGYKRPRYQVGRPSIITPNRFQRDFSVDQPNKVWVTDITYIRTWQGWLYLSEAVDLFTRKVIGRSTKPTLSRELAVDALLMAVWHRKPSK